jgi:hypothetical protein
MTARSSRRLINQSPGSTLRQAILDSVNLLGGGGGDNNAVAFRYDGDADFADGDVPIRGEFLSD